MSLRFYLGPSGSGKSRMLYEEVVERSMKEPNRNYLMIVPDQFTMQTQKDICALHPRGGILNIDVLSFSRLAHRVFEEIGMTEKVLLDDTGKNLMIRRITQEKKDSLKVMQKNLDKIGYIHEIKSCISEFMQYGITQEELEGLIAHASGNDLLVGKLEDLQCIYREMKNVLEEQYTTSEEVYITLRNGLIRSNLIQDAVVVFDGFTGFTPLQNLVIAELLKHTRELIVTITMDVKEGIYGASSEQHLFYLSHKAITSLMAIEKEITGLTHNRERDVILGEETVVRYKENKELAFLERELFRYGNVCYEDAVENIVIQKCKSLEEEVHCVCGAITRLVREQGYAYHEIAIVSGNPLLYVPYIRREFGKYKIPYFLDVTKGIQLNPCIEYVKSALEVVLKGYGYEGMFHYLKSGMVDYELEEIDLLENYVIKHGLKRKFQWEQTWSVGEEAEEEERILLDRLNEIREDIVDKLRVFSMEKKSVREHTMVLYDFVVQTELEQKLNAYQKLFNENGDFDREKEYAQIYRYFMDLLDQFMALMAEEELSLKEYAQILYAGFEEIQIGVIPQNRDMIIIGDIERTRLKEMKTLFFIGVNDGIIPKATSSGGIISDLERELLQGANVEMAPTPRQQMYQQKLYIYMNLTKPTQTLYVTYSGVDSEGKSVRPAYLIGTICKLFPKLVVQEMKQECIQECMQDYVVTKERGIDYLGKLLREYVLHGGEGIGIRQEGELKALYTWCNQEDDTREQVELLVDAAFYEYKDRRLSKSVAQMLYGTMLQSSVSRLEQYASCAYSYFLKYGLGLMEREELSLEKVDIGNVFHGVLEEFGQQLEKSGSTWFDFTEDMGKELLEQAIEDYSNDYEKRLFANSARNEYALTRIKRILNRTIQTLQYQLSKGSFVPKELELSFERISDYQEIDISLGEAEKMKLRGKIDRVDLCEEEKQVYVKVIDYKSSQHTFDVVALYHGLQLQLVVYMNAATSYIQEQYPKKEVEPAAILYYHVNDPLIDLKGENYSEEKIAESIREKLQMKGLVNADLEVIEKLDGSKVAKSDVVPVAFNKDGSFKSSSSVMSKEHMKLISEYVTHRISRIGQSIVSGDIEVNPYEMGDRSSCTYCKYGAVCKYDGKIEGYGMRRLGLDEAEDVLERIEKREWDSNTPKTNKK
ncbi:MAG: helicase-exonuclease AddAB subunit AddB [Eubacteriales bacterium]